MRKAAIGALAFGVLLVIAGTRLVDLRDERRTTIAAAEARADNLSLIIAAYISEGFRAADASLRQLQFHSQRIGGPFAPASSWTPSLNSARAGLTGVGAITVIDRAGTIHHSTRPEIVGQSRRNESLTRQIEASTDDQLAIGTPFPTIATRDAPSELIIPIGRRLVSTDGTLEGSLVASFRPQAPRNLLRQINVGTRGSISVFHPEGVILFREPVDKDATGQSVRENPVFAAAKQGSGTIEAPLEPGEPVMLTVFRTTAAPPLIVAVSMDRDEVLAGWWNEATDSMVLFGCLALVLSGVMVVLFRQMDARASVEHAFAEAQALERERLRGANEQLAGALARERQARNDAEAASALKDEFLMTVSHELRTPLTAIYGWARMLNHDAVSDSQRALAMKTIERNAEAQTRLIEDLLDVSSVITGKLKIDVRSVQPADVVQSAIETVSPAAAAKSIDIQREIDPGIGPVSCDPDRLQQIVWNLLSNAVKFTPAHGTIRVAVTRERNDLIVRISDSGIGISPEFLPHVFDRFRQEDAGTKRRVGGLGLGLAIVRSLVELHGGTVTAESDGANRGATFTIRLPLPASAGRAERLRSPSGTAWGATSRVDDVSVLVVDDDPEARELFAAVLQNAGASVVAVSSASAALAALRERPVDVLVSDIEMPGEDGYSLVRQALAIGASEGAPLAAIAVSAYARPEDQARSLASGFSRHLCKPVDPGTLVSAVRDAGQMVTSRTAAR